MNLISMAAQIWTMGASASTWSSSNFEFAVADFVEV
jgi:hypothetical protein